MKNPWHKHPHVRTGDQLSFGERSADLMRNGFGSWAFVAGFALFLALWMLTNTAVLHSGWDPYPYILLNLCLSCLAALQGAFILIAAKRADRVAAEQALAHYKETSKIDSLLTENTTLTEEIRTLTTQVHELVSDKQPVQVNVSSAELDPHILAQRVIDVINRQKRDNGLKTT